jgi:undecaprenyl-diphosphatase
MSSPTTTTDTPGTSGSGHDGPGWLRVIGLAVLAWLVICALVVGWGWLLTHPLESSIEPMDDDVARWFADQRTADLTDVANFGTYLGETIIGASIFVVVGLIVSVLKRTWRPIIFVALVEAGIGGIYFFGTELIPRDRPPVKLLDAGLVPDASFPSGHVATSLVCWAGTMILVWTYFRAARWLADRLHTPGNRGRAALAAAGGDAGRSPRPDVTGAGRARRAVPVQPHRTPGRRGRGGADRSQRQARR